MADVFISYAHTTAKQAQGAAAALRSLGYSVWLDDELAAHRAYTHAIEEQLVAAKAALVIWSTDAARSEWVLSEANRAREDHKLVQLVIDKTRLPMPFDQLQCADLKGWSGEGDHPNWRKVVAGIGELVSGAPLSAAAPTQDAPLTLPSKPSIAVLPFANLSSDPEQEYFADGMTEEIVSALSRFRTLFVIASGTTLALKSKSFTPQDAARLLGVRYILQGSVRKAVGRVRIAVTLSDGADGAQIWAERFEDGLDDVFALQDRVALSVGGVIEPALMDAEGRRLIRRPTANMSSYELYLKAYALYQRFQEADMSAAMELVDQATALDPNFAAALVLAANGHRMLLVYGWGGDPADHQRLGLELVERAIAAAPNDDFVLSMSAMALLMGGQGSLGRARSLLDRALTLNSGSAFNWFSSGVQRAAAGEDDDLVVSDLERAMRLDPLSAINRDARMLVGVTRFRQGRFAEALSLLNEANSPHPYATLIQASVLAHLGQLTAAAEALARYRATATPSAEAVAQSYFLHPEHQKRFLNGIAMADGKVPPDENMGV